MEKKYIGQTLKNDINSRWKQHKKMCKYSLGNCLYNAYKKYGIENFKFKILCICFDSDLNNYEVEYIKKYNTIYPNGYNLQTGGNNRKHNEYTIKHLKDVLSGVNSPNYGKKLSLEKRQQISERLKGEKNPNFGKKISQEIKLKISKTMLNFDIIKRKEINKKISDSLKQYNNKTNNSNNIKRKKIGQYNLNDNLIAIFNSISEASQKIGIDRMTISKCCNDKYVNYKTAKGFIWKYII
jgi:group I intron endonuclease